MAKYISTDSGKMLERKKMAFTKHKYSPVEHYFDKAFIPKQYTERMKRDSQRYREEHINKMRGTG